VLVGELDVRSPVAVARAIAEAIPGARLEVLEGLAHQAAMEGPEAFNAAVRGFLRG
jgi:3-oxoadipate enol-lactonase